MSQANLVSRPKPFLYCPTVATRKRPTPDEIFQALLRQVRVDAGLRQVDLAERLGQPQSVVSKNEAGERRVDLIELRRICNAVGITIAEFVERFEDALK